MCSHHSVTAVPFELHWNVALGPVNVPPGVGLVMDGVIGAMVAAVYWKSTESQDPESRYHSRT